MGEEKKFQFEVNENDLNAIYLGLMELPAKYSLDVLNRLRNQVKEESHEESSDKQEVPEE